jgi:hypothetical protein
VRIDHLLRQQVTWQVRTGLDSRSDPTYATAKNVPARVVLKTHDVIGKDGENVTATTCYTLTVQPAIGDLLDGREVVVVNGMTTVGGDTIGYQAFTR